MWYEPSTSRTRTPWTGAPARSPCAIASWIALVHRRPEALRDDAADDLVHELVADVALRSARARCGSRRIGRARPSASCSGRVPATPRGSSRGTARAADAARRPPRSGAWRVRARPRRASGSCPRGSPRPVCWSRRSRRVGSSSASLRIALATFSSSPFAFGVTAKLITGSGKPKSTGSTSTSLSSSRSPVCASFSFATAPMSPGPKSLPAVCSLPCSSSSVPMRSLPFVRLLTSVESPVMVPVEHAEEVDAPSERIGDRLEDERGG